MAEGVETKEGQRCLMCHRPLQANGLCATCEAKVRVVRENFKAQAEEIAADPQRNKCGFGPEAILGAMLRQSGWADYFALLGEKS
jgi:hypothetical protein